MSNALADYLEGIISIKRHIAAGADSEATDAIRDEIDAYWLALTQDERDLARKVTEYLYA